MNKIIVTLLIVAVTKICSAQTTQTIYYNNRWFEKEVSAGKGKFSKTITKNADETVTIEVKNIKKNKIEYSETYKGAEPYGIWIYQTSKGTSQLEYNFPLTYAGKECKDSIPSVIMDSYFEDNDTIGYKAPKLAAGETSIYQSIADNLVYPTLPKEEGIQGKVYVVFTITKDGSIENVYIKKGVNVFLDKEALRVIRLLRFSTPPTLNGQPQSFCITMPIIFSLI